MMAKNKKTCGNCDWQADNGVCVNDKSDNCADFVSDDDHGCAHWEKRNMKSFYCKKKGHITAANQEEAARLSGCRGCGKWRDTSCDGPAEQEKLIEEKSSHLGKPPKVEKPIAKSLKAVQTEEPAPVLSPEEPAPVVPVPEAIENIETTSEPIETDPVLAMLAEMAQNPIKGAEQKNRVILEKYGAAIAKAASAGNSPYVISKKLASVGVKISSESIKGFLSPGKKGERAA